MSMDTEEILLLHDQMEYRNILILMESPRDSKRGTILIRNRSDFKLFGHSSETMTYLLRKNLETWYFVSM